MNNVEFLVSNNVLKRYTFGLLTTPKTIVKQKQVPRLFQKLVKDKA